MVFKVIFVLNITDLMNNDLMDLLKIYSVSVIVR